MKKHIVFSIVIYFVIQLFSLATAQTGQVVVSSEKVLVGGKAYYLHKVEAGQTLYSIAKAYNVLPNEVAEENPEVFQSLPVGHQLKIPIIKGRNNTIDEIEHSDKFVFHYIEKGETLYSLAKNNSTTVETIVKWNPETAEKVKPGDVIKIPKPGVDPALLENLLPEKQAEKQGDIVSHDQPGYIFHQVEKGQTLYFISKKYDISREILIELNPGADKTLAIGQMLKIPKPTIDPIPLQTSQNIAKQTGKDTIKTKEAKGFLEHTVQKGETLFSISRKYQLQKEDIVRYNPGAEAVLSIGTVLQVPIFEKSENAQGLNEILGNLSGKTTPIDTFVWEDRRFYYHKVEPKETLYSLSKFYDIKLRKLKKANEELKDRDICIGEIIRVPKEDIKDIGMVARLVKAKHARQFTEGIEKVPGYKPISVLPCDTFEYNSYRDTFRVALMVPFYLYENDTMQVNDSLRFEKLLKTFFDDKKIEQAKFPAKPGLRIYDESKVFLEFYNGFLLSVDSARQMGINLELFVYNTQNNKDSVRAILRKPKLKNMDLIIGPVLNQNLEIVSKFALENKIPFVSPLISPDTFNIANPWFFQVKPSLDTQIQKFCNLISNYYSKNIVLMHYGTKEEAEVVALYQKYLPPMLKARAGQTPIRFKVVELNRERAFDIIKPEKGVDDKEIIRHPIKKELIDSIQNLVIIPASERGLVSNTIRQLNSIYEETVSDYEITICGFPNVLRFENIDLEYLHNLEFHTFLTSHIDYDNQAVKDFIKKYRQVFMAEPSQFSFQAFDIGLYFLQILKGNGKYFQDCVENYPTYRQLQNEFEFRQTDYFSGFENQHVYILKYDRDYDIVRLDLLFKSFAEEKANVIQKGGLDEVKPQQPGDLKLYRKPK